MPAQARPREVKHQYHISDPWNNEIQEMKCSSIPDNVCNLIKYSKWKLGNKPTHSLILECNQSLRQEDYPRWPSFWTSQSKFKNSTKGEFNSKLIPFHLPDSAPLSHNISSSKQDRCSNQNQFIQTRWNSIQYNSRNWSLPFRNNRRNFYAEVWTNIFSTSILSTILICSQRQCATIKLHSKYSTMV